MKLDEVHTIERILKDIIDYGFSENVEEELLEFDDKGDLTNTTSGTREKPRGNMGLISIRGGGLAASYDDASSIYSHSQMLEEEEDEEHGEDYSESQSRYN